MSRTLTPADTKTCSTDTAAKAACAYRRCRWVCGTALATFRRSIPSARCCVKTFDLGITHFDLANNYGPLRAALKKILAACCEKILPGIATS